MIRIISGEFKGRKLKVPDGQTVRPTTDRMRERIFSILTHDRYPAFEGAHVADFFAGTGALGLEALSRGASHVTFLEQSPAALSSLLSNIDALGVDPKVNLLTRDATACGMANNPYDFIFMDAPYERGLTKKALDAIAAGRWLKPDGVIVAECHTNEEFDLPQGFAEADTRIQGVQKTLFIMRGDVI